MGHLWAKDEGNQFFKHVPHFRHSTRSSWTFSLNFDLEIFCDIYYCGKFGDLIDSQIARVFTIWQIKGARSVRNWSITEFLFIAVGLPQSGVSWMVLLNVCLLTNGNVITYREVTVSVNKTNAMAYTADWAGHGFK